MVDFVQDGSLFEIREHICGKEHRARVCSFQATEREGKLVDQLKSTLNCSVSDVLRIAIVALAAQAKRDEPEGGFDFKAGPFKNSSRSAPRGKSRV